MYKKKQFNSIEDAATDELFCYALDGIEAGSFVVTTDCPENEIQEKLNMYKEEMNKINFHFIDFADFLNSRGYSAISGNKSDKILSLY